MANENRYIKFISILMAIMIAMMLVYLAMRQIDEYQLQDEPKLNLLREKFTTFFNQDKQWNGRLVMLNNRKPMKEINLYKGNKSYTINKEKVYMCLKDENGDYYSDNMLIYVLAHEFSHVLCESVGHTDEFFKIFEDMLAELTTAGIYDPNQEIIQNYCQFGDNS